MSSGSALSHLINRNLCYNDLSMSLWLYAYAMRSLKSSCLGCWCWGNLHTHSSSLFVSEWSGILLDDVKPGPSWQDTHTLRPNISRTPAFLLCGAFPPPVNNLFFILSTWFQQATYLDASNLFDQIANTDFLCVCVCVCVCACIYCTCQWGPSYVSVCVCVCVLSWPVAWCTSPAEQCSGLSLLFE